MNRPLLIVDDDPGIQRQLRWSFDGHDVVVAGDRAGALAAVRQHRPAVVTLDLGLPPDANGPGEGLATLAEILAVAPETKVIVVTGNDDRSAAVQAIALGAYDFYAKPIDPALLRLVVERAYRLSELEEENRQLRVRSATPGLDEIITSSPPMLSVCRMIEKAAPTELCVLVLGESGTGKELVARALHRLSRRADKPFVAINCAAIPENLLESELFGFEKGAFTGAVKQTLGRLEMAQGGTVFLDEVGDLPRPLQVKLLRVLQERVVERVGGRRPIALDVRFVAATNRDLQQCMQQGEFREDLYYRLTEMVVELPPLRERKEDAVLIAQALLARYGAGRKPRASRFTPDALFAIGAYDWPGNVRELENRVKRAVLLADGSRVTAQDLGLREAEGELPPLPLREARGRAEREAVCRALAFANGNVSEAAKLLEISRPTLYGLLREHGLRSEAAPETVEEDA